VAHRPHDDGIMFATRMLEIKALPVMFLCYEHARDVVLEHPGDFLRETPILTRGQTCDRCEAAVRRLRERCGR
jgi:hypothetical protein